MTNNRSGIRGPTMRMMCCMLAVLAVLGSSSRLTAAQNANPGLTLDKVSPDLSLGSTAIVDVGGLSALGADGPKLADFILYIDQYAVTTGADPQLSNVAGNRLAFPLKRDSDNASAWKALLGSPTNYYKKVQVAVGIKGQQNLLPIRDQTKEDKNSLQATLWVIWLPGVLIALVLVVILFFVLRKYGIGDMLRDSQPSDFGGVTAPNGNLLVLKRPYSLAQTQMAWWFALVVGAYIFLFLITGDINTLTSQALTLMGIGAGTALGAAMVENTKTDPKQKEFQDTLAQIKQLETANPQPPELSAARAKRDRLAQELASKNFFIDTLTDVDGMSLHRFQLMAWTVIMGLIFCFEVYQNLALPEYSGTILALLGISGGTYLGFKVPEQPV